MATPDFVLHLRSHVGNELLWLPGVTAVITDEDLTRVLLVRRADNGQWTPVTGIIDPGEEPAYAGAREAWEEASVRVRPHRLVSTEVVGPVEYENGDRSLYLDLSFHMIYESGDPYPADGENSEVAWFDAGSLPAMNARFTQVVGRVLAGEDGAAVFDKSTDGIG
ncbi:MAG: NUDIX domain-containing protein [Actinomycetaceae bacterium]|nr:NUDIX domain-containing protein [Actinomycetaceae bacterium]